MARKLRIEYDGAIYHVTCRMLGNTYSKLFIDDADRHRFVKSLAERVKQYNIRLYMYVLMSNHFHLVFETPMGNCSKFMQSLSTSYTVYYNLRHNRHGHLLDGRYKAKLVDGDDYLSALSRYVHLNPIKVLSMREKTISERLDDLNQYTWSSYQGYINKSARQEFVDYMPVLASMPGKKSGWEANYKKFVESGIAEDDKDFISILNASSLAVGGDGYLKWIKGKYEEMIDNVINLEDVSFRHTAVYLEVDVVLEIIADVLDVSINDFSLHKRNSPLKAIAAILLIKYAGKNQREIAKLLGVSSGAAINGQISRYKEKIFTDKRLNKRVKMIEKILDKKHSLI